MNWAERIIRAGAPGPVLVGRRARQTTRSDWRSAIAVGVDDSERSADALALGRLLAGWLGYRLVLVPNLAGEGLEQIAERDSVELIVLDRPISGASMPMAIAPPGWADEEHSLTLIACAFDGSPESRLALGWSARLAMRAACRLRVISVHKPVAVAGLGFAAQSVDPISRDELKRTQEVALASYDLPIEGLVRDGNPTAVVVDACRDANLLVMGSRGYGPLRAALLGSVSRYAVRHAACPVVIHPNTQKPG